MLRFRRAIVLLLVLAGAASAATSAPIFGEIDEMLASLSKITGWEVHRKVPAEMLSNDKFRQILKSHVDKSDPKKIHAEELTLRMFGLVPNDFSLAKETVDLFGEQVAAYYDSEKKRLYVLDNVATDLDRRVALVHELAHALADQQHSLLKYLKGKGPHRIKEDEDTDDATTARQAVMEGQAVWLTWAYVAGRNGSKAEVPSAMLDTLAKASGGGEDMPVYATSPLYFRESLIFPYTQGLRFTDSVYRKLGQKAFEEVFERPPASTQNIMHPDTYLADKKPVMERLPELKEEIGKDASRFSLLTEGDLGEFDVSILLRQFTSEKDAAAESPHLQGAGFRLWENKTTKAGLLLHQTEWDSPETARRFFELYRSVLKKKSKVFEVADEGPDSFHGMGDLGKFEARLKGSVVQVLEGLR
jgi:hypothetical protein